MSITTIVGAFRLTPVTAFGMTAWNLVRQNSAFCFTMAASLRCNLIGLRQFLVAENRMAQVHAASVGHYLFALERPRWFWWVVKLWMMRGLKRWQKAWKGAAGKGEDFFVRNQSWSKIENWRSTSFNYLQKAGNEVEKLKSWNSIYSMMVVQWKFMDHSDEKIVWSFWARLSKMLQEEPWQLFFCFRTQPGTRIASIGRPLVTNASRSGLHLIRQAQSLLPEIHYYYSFTKLCVLLTFCWASQTCLIISWALQVPYRTVGSGNTSRAKKLDQIAVGPVL